MGMVGAAPAVPATKIVGCGWNGATDRSAFIIGGDRQDGNSMSVAVQLDGASGSSTAVSWMGPAPLRGTSFDVNQIKQQVAAGQAALLVRDTSSPTDFSSTGGGTVAVVGRWPTGATEEVVTLSFSGVAIDGGAVVDGSVTLWLALAPVE
jgi:hypothetical protein